MSSEQTDMSDNQDQFGVKLTDNIAESPWWAKDVEAVLQPETFRMLQDYAGIPSDQQLDHIERTASLRSDSPRRQTPR